MACGKAVFFLLALVALISCAPAGKDSSSSSNGNSSPNHQSSNQGHQNSQGQHDNRANNNKAEGDGKDANSSSANSSSSEEQNSSPKQDTQSPSDNNDNIRENHDRPGLFGSDTEFGLPNFDSLNKDNDLLNLDDHQDKAGLFGLGIPNFGQLFSGFGGSNESNPLNQFFQNPLQQMIDAFGTFIPGLGGSNSSDIPNLFSGFLPHSSRSLQIELPGDVAANNGTTDGTDDLSLHDRCFFYLFSSFLQNYLGRNNANSYGSIGCNYTTQAGYSCSGCREQLLCNTNNVGSIRICPRNAPYCYNGVCGSVVNTTACTTTTTG